VSIFQRIAYQNGGIHASGTPEYDASADTSPPPGPLRQATPQQTAGGPLTRSARQSTREGPPVEVDQFLLPGGQLDLPFVLPPGSMLREQARLVLGA
jgi:hypothetical protein